MTVLRKIYRYTQGPLQSTPFRSFLLPLLPFSPLPSLLLSPPLPFFPSPPLHRCPAVRSRCPLFQLGSLEEHCKLPQRGLGRKQNQFRSILALKSDIWWQQWFSWESTTPMPKFYPLPSTIPISPKATPFRAGLTSMPIMPWHGAPDSGGPLGRHEFFKHLNSNKY